MEAVPDQLTLFVDPNEVLDAIHYGDWQAHDASFYDDLEDLWVTKLYEAVDNGTYDSIAEIGVNKPVVLSFNYNDRYVKLGNGHHRIAAAADLGLPYVPVVWARGAVFANVNTPSD